MKVGRRPGRKACSRVGINQTGQQTYDEKAARQICRQTIRLGETDRFTDRYLETYRLMNGVEQIDRRQTNTQADGRKKRQAERQRDRQRDIQSERRRQINRQRNTGILL